MATKVEFLLKTCFFVVTLIVSPIASQVLSYENNPVVVGIPKYTYPTGCQCPGNYDLRVTELGAVCELKIQCIPLGGLCDPSGDCSCPFRCNQYNAHTKTCSGVDSDDIEVCPHAAAILSKPEICNDTPLYRPPTNCGCPKKYLYKNDRSNFNIRCVATLCPNGQECNVDNGHCYCKFDCQGPNQNSCVGDPANGCDIGINERYIQIFNYHTYNFDYTHCSLCSDYGLNRNSPNCYLDHKHKQF